MVPSDREESRKKKAILEQGLRESKKLKLQLDDLVDRLHRVNNLLFKRSQDEQGSDSNASK